MSSDKVKGTVVRFFRGRGFGFIKPEEGGKEVFVHWDDLITDDHWPYLERGTEVEFLMEKDEDKHAAKEVTLANGKKIPVFTKPYEDRIVNEDETFTGSIKFFDGRKGFGFVIPDEDISWENTSSDGEGLFFFKDALIATGAGKGMMLRVRDGLRVSFKVYKDNKGLGACKVQNEDETPLECEPRKQNQSTGKKRKRKNEKSRKSKKAKKEKTIAKTKEELIEEREIDECERNFTGTVKYYKPDKEFGFITISEEITFKDLTAKEKIYVMKEDIICNSDEIGLTPESEVMFRIYKDSKGLGACEVMNVDGTPIEYNTTNEESEKEKEPTPEPVKPKKKAATISKKKATKRTKRKRKN